MQNDDGTPHFAYYRQDKGLSFTWNGRVGNVLDVSYGGYGEPVFATLGLGFDPSTHRLPEAFAQMKKVADRAADTFVMAFWEKAIDRATFDGPARELPYCCAEGGYAKDGDGVVRCGTCWDDFTREQEDAAAGFTDSVTAAGFTAAGFTEHPSQRFIRNLRGARYAEALAGGAVIRHTLAEGLWMGGRYLTSDIQMFRAGRVEDFGNEPDVLPGPILSRGYAGG